MKKKSYITAVMAVSLIFSMVPLQGMQRAQSSFKRLKRCFSQDSDTRCTAMDKIKIARDMIGAMIAIIAAAKIVEKVKSKPFPEPLPTETSFYGSTEGVATEFQAPPLKWFDIVEYKGENWIVRSSEGDMITILEQVPWEEKLRGRIPRTTSVNEKNLTLIKIFNPESRTYSPAREEQPLLD